MREVGAGVWGRVWKEEEGLDKAWRRMHWEGGRGLSKVEQPHLQTLSM